MVPPGNIFTGSSTESYYIDENNQSTYLINKPVPSQIWLGQNTVRLKIIDNEIIKNVGKHESCTVSKLPIIFKRTRTKEVTQWYSLGLIPY